MRTPERKHAPGRLGPAMPASALPTCCAIVVNGGTSLRQYLYMSGGHATSEDYTMFGEVGDRDALSSNMHTRFYLVPSKKHGDKLMHFKSAYNNKYLVAKQNTRNDQQIEGNLLVGTADEPKEELTQPSCTLFKVEQYMENPRLGRLRFTHPSEEKICCFVSAASWNNGLTTNFNNVVDLIEVAETIVLPPYVTLKGPKGLYLRVSDIEGHPYLEFASVDKADKSATFTPINYVDGQFRLKSELNGNFLGVRDGWIWADYPENEEHKNLFRLLKFGDFFALQNTSHGGFCTQTKKNDTVCLNSGSENITDDTKIWLEEPVLTREIYNIVYHRNENARIYDTTDMNMASASAINMTSEKNTVKSSLTITTTESSKFESTSTHKGNVSLSMSGGFSLFKIIDANVEVQGGYEYSKAKTWGTSSETEKEQKIEYEISVPPKKKVTLTVTSKQAKCDVPFSYTQRDKLPNGETKIYNYDDGLYTGMNCFDLRYETKEEAIELKKEEIQLKDEEDETKEQERERPRSKRGRGQGR